MPSEFPRYVRRVSVLFSKTVPNLYHQSAKISFKKLGGWGCVLDVKTFWHSIPRQICSSDYIKQKSSQLSAPTQGPDMPRLTWNLTLNLLPFNSSDKLLERRAGSGAICSDHGHWKGLHLTPNAPTLCQFPADLPTSLSGPRQREGGRPRPRSATRAPSGRGRQARPGSEKPVLWAAGPPRLISQTI